MLKIYHNPRCKISREVLAILQKETDDIEIIEYLKTKPSIDELKEICMKLNLPAEALARKNENIFKKSLKGKKFSEIEWLTIINENPSLIERPIVVTRYKAIICRPAEKVQDLLTKK